MVGRTRRAAKMDTYAYTISIKVRPQEGSVFGSMAFTEHTLCMPYVCRNSYVLADYIEMEDPVPEEEIKVEEE